MSAETPRPKLDADIEAAVNAWAGRMDAQGNSILCELRQPTVKKWKRLKAPRYLFRP